MILSAVLTIRWRAFLFPALQPEYQAAMQWLDGWPVEGTRSLSWRLTCRSPRATVVGFWFFITSVVRATVVIEGPDCWLFWSRNDCCWLEAHGEMFSRSVSSAVSASEPILVLHHIQLPCGAWCVAETFSMLFLEQCFASTMPFLTWRQQCLRFNLRRNVSLWSSWFSCDRRCCWATCCCRPCWRCCSSSSSPPPGDWVLSILQPLWFQLHLVFHVKRALVWFSLPALCFIHNRRASSLQ